MTEVKEVAIGENLDYVKDLKEFKDSIIHHLLLRFTTKPGTNTNKRIVTVDVMNNKNHIIATLLDPRFKQYPFEGNIKAQSNLFYYA